MVEFIVEIFVGKSKRKTEQKTLWAITYSEALEKAYKEYGKDRVKSVYRKPS